MNFTDPKQLQYFYTLHFKEEKHAITFVLKKLTIENSEQIKFVWVKSKTIKSTMDIELTDKKLARSIYMQQAFFFLNKISQPVMYRESFLCFWKVKKSIFTLFMGEKNRWKYVHQISIYSTINYRWWLSMTKNER